MSEDCFCERDPDGQCPKCREIAVSAGVHFKKMVTAILAAIDQMQKEFMAGMQSTIAKMANKPSNVDLFGSCDGCAEQYVDLAIAKMVEALSDQERSTGLIVLRSIVRQIHKRGIKKLPLTEKAWFDLSGETQCFSL